MNKKITIELTEKEYDELCKLWEQAKKSPIMPSKALNIDDFVKEIITMDIKAPDFSNLNMDDIMSQINEYGGLEGMKDLFDKLEKKPNQANKKDVSKKDDLPDDQKYKS